MKALVLALSLWAVIAAPFASGVADGRDGNRALAAGDSSAAADAFRLGLAADPPRWARARLTRNLGLAVLARDPGLADSLLAASVALTDDPAHRATNATDAGLAALAAEDPARAVAHLRRALLLAPASGRARRAYEIARRRLDASGAPTPEAEAIKAQAERLVEQRRYEEALRLMERSRERVPSLAAFDDWTGRLSGVAGIEQNVGDAPEGDAPADTTAPPDAVSPP
jgi:tetratricopeptide (TPR) repeat protein